MIERLAQFIQSQGLSVRAFELSIKASDGMIRRAINNRSDIQSKWIALIADNYPHLSLDWLVTGKGSMLRDSQTLDEKKSSTPPISPAEESIIYKMYKEKDIEVGALKEEIGALKLRIQQLESKNEDSASLLLSDKVTEAFTSESLGDYGEGFSHTNPSTISKRSSAGKV